MSNKHKYNYPSGELINGVWVQNVYCNHRRDVIPIGKDHFILASEYSFTFDPSEKPIPDLGIYLSDVWSGLVASPSIRGELSGFEPYKPLYPTILLDCDDGGMVDHRTLDWLVKGIINYIRQGKLVEIGCFGGHGRTGTLLACIVGKYEGKDARRAILAVRSRYCEQAVETKRQIRAIANYLNNPLSIIDKVEPSKGVLSLVQTWDTKGNFAD